VFQFENIAEVTTTLEWLFKGLHRALRCEVHGGSSEFWLPANFPTFGRITIRPHELPTTATIVRHLRTQLIYKRSWINWSSTKLTATNKGPTHQSLTDIDGGYSLGGANLPHHTPRPSQPMIVRFPPKGPVRSQVIHSQHKPQVQCDMKHLSPTYGLSTTQRVPKSRTTHNIANVFQILARSSRSIQKVFILQLHFQSTPINLTHNSP
jgi:hypothetical protein